MVNVANHHGGIVTLTATFTQISQSTIGMQSINVRNGLSNAACELGNADGVTGILDAGDSKQYLNMRPFDIWVRGTAGQLIYWDASA